MPTPFELRLQDRLAMLQGRRSGLEDILSGGVGAGREKRLTRRIGRIDKRIGRAESALDISQGVPAPPPVPPGGPSAPPPPPSAAPLSPQDALAQMLQGYTPPELSGAAASQNFYQQGLSRLNALPQPSFEDMFSRYRQVAEREADRNAARITEAFGARGARYGSDLLNAQGDLRRKLTEDLGVQADAIQRGMEEQRNQSINTLGQFGYNQQQLQNSRQQNALAYLFADAIRRTGPPPLLAGAGQYASSFGPPTTVIQ
jgi:hypothetical protein